MSDGTVPGPLAGRRVLVVEDDWLIAEHLRDQLDDVGAEIMGPVASVEDALALLERHGMPDAAVLDVRLTDGVSYPVAEVLQRQAVPMIFATGSPEADVNRVFPNTLCVDKVEAVPALARLFSRG